MEHTVQEKKKKFSFWIQPELLERIEKAQLEYGGHTKSDFITKSIEFYLSYLEKEKSEEFLLPTLTTVMHSQLYKTEKNMCEMLFKVAVEQALISNILSAELEIDISDIDKLRDTCARMVAQSNGIISFERAYHFQKGD